MGSVLLAQGWPTFYSAYEDGLKAQGKGEHHAAIDAFSKAAAMEPRPGTRVRTYGLNYLPTYYPYLRMAESQLALGNLAAAERSLEISKSLGLEPAGERESLLGRLRSMNPAPVAIPAKHESIASPSGPLPAPVTETLPSVGTEIPDVVSPPIHVPPVPGQKEGTSGKAARRTAEADARPAMVKTPTAVAPVEPVPARFRNRLSWIVPAALMGIGGIWIFLRMVRRGPIQRKRASPVESAAKLGDGVLVPRFGPYLVLGKLGSGGCATAFRAVHELTGKEVALKVPHPHLVENETFLVRFRREAELGLRLDHPRIVRTLDIAASGEPPWIAMAFIQGVPLHDILERKGALPVPDVIRIGSDIASALVHAHEKGVVHRDLKPSNIMISAEGAVVMDFGIARIMDSSLTGTSLFMGTPAYAAPEALSSAKAGPAADWYALGIILFEMLIGKHPFAGLDGFELLEAHRFKTIPEMTRPCPDVPSALGTLIQDLCAKKPEDRPGDAAIVSTLEELGRLDVGFDSFLKR
jgi:hypothetical protein